MPRRDAPGAVHHVTLRGVAQCDVFVDDVDRGSLRDRIARVSDECDLTVLAFAFMSNHVHLLVRTGRIPLARAMARIGTGHALHFNRRHGRVGHLFQNRYKATPVESDAHLRNTIRYVHANPLAAGIVSSLGALEAYPWTGHAQLFGRRAPGPVDVRAALAPFGESNAEARRELRRFMRGWRADAANDKDDDFAPARLPRLEAEIARVAGAFGVAAELIAAGSRRSEVCRARAEIARVAIAVHGISAREVALRLGVTHAAVLRGAARAERSGRTGP